MAKQRADVPDLTQEEQERLVAAVRERRAQQGGYPLTLRDALRRAGLAEAAAVRVLKSQALHSVLTIAARSDAAQAIIVDAPLALATDVQQLAASDQVLGYTLALATGGAGKAHSITQLANYLPVQLQQAFKTHWKQSLASGRLPSGIAAIKTSRSTLLFCEKDVLFGHPRPTKTIPATVAPPAAVSLLAPPALDRALSSRLLVAFAEVDRAQGSANHVLLSDLRAALPDIEPRAFEAAVSELRRQRRLSLEAADGRHEPLTAEQLQAGIIEEGETLVYAQVRPL